MLVKQLREIQDSNHGILPDKELRKLSEGSGIALPRIQEVVSFFPHFRQEWNPPPEVEVHVCRDMACHLAGSAELLHELRRLEKDDRPQELPRAAKDLRRRELCVEGVSCLGRCDRAPAMMVTRHGEHPLHDNVYAGRRKIADNKRIIEEIVAGGSPPPDTDAGYAGLSRNPDWELDFYKADPKLEPFTVVRQHLKEFPTLPSPPPKDNRDRNYTANRHPWLAKLDPSNLLGMGGAGVPVYKKWNDLWIAEGTTKYVVCNGDESEPSTFKDREILLKAPHIVVEGMILAGLLTGASQGYIFIRHEYTEQAKAVDAAIKAAEDAGCCGENMCGTSRSFKLEVFVSPGGYICGEQTALIEAIQGNRGQPRVRPPELSTNGLHDKPTIVNNVESISWTPTVLHHGPQWYVDRGKQIAIPEYDAKLSALPAPAPASVKHGFKGRRYFSICGDLEKPGVFEVPIGMPLGELIRMAGGIRGGRALQAVALSGPSGGFIPRYVPLKPEVPEKIAKYIERKLGEVKAGDLSPAGRGKLDASAGEYARMKLFLESNPFHTDGGKVFFNLLAAPLDLEFFRTMNGELGVKPELMLGAGLAVYDETRDMAVEARNCTQFFRNESCGKCVPCRIGGEKLVGLTTDLLRSQSKRVPEDEDCNAAAGPERGIDFVREIDETLTLTSICSLGVSAPKPLLTYLTWFDPKRGG